MKAILFRLVTVVFLVLTSGGLRAQTAPADSATDSTSAIIPHK